MTKYNIWVKDEEEKNQAIKVNADNITDAVLKWANIKLKKGWFCGNFKELIVYVLDKYNKCEEYVVHGEFILKFYTSKKE